MAAYSFADEFLAFDFSDYLSKRALAWMFAMGFSFFFGEFFVEGRVLLAQESRSKQRSMEMREAAAIRNH